MDAIQQAVFQSLSTIVVALIGLATKELISFLNSKKVSEKLQGKQDIILIVVKAVEQLWGAGGGDEKLKAARKFAIKELAENNIKITDAELDLFIEAAVGEIKSHTPTLVIESNSPETQD